MFPLRLFDPTGTSLCYSHVPYFMTKYQLLSTNNSSCSSSNCLPRHPLCFFPADNEYRHVPLLQKTLSILLFASSRCQKKEAMDRFD
ncbi:hypothetical protein OIU74_025894 [Salix koriyanagi]|uniref:Uncharacterized protein n=1 Tax=Salix koriyanagi TaxID=2511006 RepID=A0A9Q0W2R5_9ROSI|nr:hypothetical protein OIU74_025894 [Salix koriyanagi]